jgi:hypothetical protein
MTASHRQETLDEARVQFGKMLLRWRNRYGWSGKTCSIWAKACPDVLPWGVSSATWTGFELGRAHAPAPETFLAFEAMNLALASGNHGPITDRTLKDRIASAKPFVDDQGQPWRAGDFFDCFIGELSPPGEFADPGFDGTAIAAELRARFQQDCKALGLGVVTCLLRLFCELPSQLGGVAAQQEAEDALTSGQPFRTSETAEAVSLALDAMEERIEKGSRP